MANKKELNQRERKEREYGENKAFGKRDRAVEAALREKRIEQSQIKFEEEQGLTDQEEGLGLLGERSQFQLVRALRGVFGGNATPQQMDFIDRHGQKKEYFVTKKGNQVTITIVDFPPPPNPQNSS